MLTDREEIIAMFAIMLYESITTKGDVDYEEEEDGVHIVTEMELDDDAVEATMEILRQSDLDNIEMMHFTYYEEEPEDEDE